MKVAFQGELGAFSQQAIRQLLGPRAKPIARQRFDEVFASLRSGQVEAAALPIENTLAGSVHENYDLLLKYDFEITAETSVRIVHNLVAAPGTAFGDVRQVFSHPVALNQCQDFFSRHKRIERVPFYDTAGSVKMVMEQRPAGGAAIASALAAQIYGGRILKREIEDDRRNFTPFQKSGLRGADRGIDVARTRERHLAELLAGRGVRQIEVIGGGGCNPLPADVVAEGFHPLSLGTAKGLSTHELRLTARARRSPRSRTER